MKTCTKCGNEYPLTLKYFLSRKNRKSKWHSWCRECCRKITKKYQHTLNGYLRQIFYHMNCRCNNPKHWNYKIYGGRGIKCLFESADEFIDYVLNKLKIDPRKLQIDRINNNGHYEKGNIRFVTAKVNANNRRKRK